MALVFVGDPQNIGFAARSPCRGLGERLSKPETQTGSHALRLVPPAAAEEAAPLDARSDDELMLLTRGGSRRAFDVLVRRHQHRVLAAAYKYVGDASWAADCAQNAFVEVYRARDRYQPRGRFTGFLYRIVHNQCRMAVRARAYERRKRASLASEPPPDASPRAESRILERERQREIASAVGKLSEKLRSVVMLRYGADLSYREIAEALDIPTGTVKRRVFDATEKLERMLGGSL